MHVRGIRNADIILVRKTKCSDPAYHKTCKVWFDLTRDRRAFVIKDTVFRLLLILLSGLTEIGGDFFAARLMQSN